MAVAGHILVRTEPCRAAAMPGQRLRHEIGKAPGRLRHDRQGHYSGLPVNRDNARERQPDFFGMAFRSLEIANLSRCQGMAFPVGTVARAASASADSGKACHTKGKEKGRENRGT